MTIQDTSKANKGLFLVLWFLCILCSWSVFPYTQYLGMIPSSVVFTKIFLLASAQALLIFGLVCWLSYLLVPKTDLFPFSTEKPLKRIVCPGVVAGFSVGLAIYLFDITVFKSSILTDLDCYISIILWRSK